MPELRVHTYLLKRKMKLKVLNTEGKETGREVELPEDVFGIEPNDHVIYLAVKQHMANKRQGTHKAKERNEVAGSTKKIKKQKGTGTARAGAITSPVFRGGGRIFGPRPRNYGFKLNKKVKELAKRSALSYKAKNNELVIVEDFSMDAPKTKQFAGIINKLSGGQKATLCIAEKNESIYLSSRNVPNNKVFDVNDLSTYEAMWPKVLILTEKSLEALKN